MNEIETLYLNRITLNTAYIFFDDIKKAKDCEDSLIDGHFRYLTYINKHKDVVYYGFKIYGIKRRIIELATMFKGVID